MAALTRDMLKDVSGDQILEALGLEKSKGVVDYLAPALGIFGAGILVGVGLGMAFAPKTGRELREDIGRRVGEVRERMRPGAEHHAMESRPM